jgi:nitrogenase-associated protein
MASVIFLEKTGCAGNAKQKALLIASGHEVQAQDLRSKAWTNTALLDFLAGLPVPQWFNRSAPAVKSGEIVPEELDEPTALGLLRENPLLIRRPLMQVGAERRVGFDAPAIDAWIGLRDVPAVNLEACQRPAAAEPELDAEYYVQTIGGGSYPCRFPSPESDAGRCN